MYAQSSKGGSVDGAKPASGIPVSPAMTAWLREYILYVITAEEMRNSTDSFVQMSSYDAMWCGNEKYKDATLIQPK